MKGGTITSPPLGNFSLSKARHRRLAEDPLLTKTLYLTPNHSDQAFQILELLAHSKS